MVGQRAEGMITLGSQYYDSEDASIDYEWAIAVAFLLQAFSLHHRLALYITGLIARVHRKNGWRGKQAVSRGSVCITGATKYYALVWNFVYNIFICSLLKTKEKGRKEKVLLVSGYLISKFNPHMSYSVQVLSNISCVST